MATVGEDAPLTSAEVHEEDEEFDISAWCKDHELSLNTQQMLTKEELTTTDALVHYVRETVSSHQPTPGPLTAGPGITMADIRRQVASLWQAGNALDALFTPEPLVPGNKTAPFADGNGHPQAPELPMPHDDPRTICNMKAGSNKAIHIIAFLTEKTTWPCARPWGKQRCLPWWRWPPLPWHFDRQQLLRNGAPDTDGGSIRGSSWILPGVHHSDLRVRQ